MASRDDVHWKFGITAKSAQLLETSLGTLLLGVEGSQKGWHALPQPEKAAADARAHREKHARNVLKKLQELAAFEGDFPGLFLSALKTRNRLMHGFYERHNFKIQTDEGRDVRRRSLHT
jgi:hypothetical protein